MKSFTLFTLMLLLVGTFFGLQSCKKYPEGGRTGKAAKNFHGGLNDEYVKQWKVTRYIVNGVDSTKLWKKGKSTDRFSYYDLQVSPLGSGFKLETEVYELNAVLSEDKNMLEVFPLDDNNLAGTQCYRTNICERNILLPTFNNTLTAQWNVVKLEKNELKLTLKSVYGYTLEMEYADQE